MAGNLHTLYQPRLIDSDGIADEASVAFYVTGTLTKANIYLDSELTIPSENPVTVDAGAEMPDIWLDPAITYRRIITYTDGSTKDTDPYSGLSANAIFMAGGGTLQDELDELAASIDSEVTDLVDTVTEAQTVTEGYRDETLAARDEALAVGSSQSYASYADLAAAVGMIADDWAIVIATDVGTHTDPVVGGTVDNAGYYTYSASPAGWERVGDLESQIVASIEDSVQVLADSAAASASIASAANGYPVFPDDPYYTYTVTSVDEDGNILIGIDPNNQVINQVALWYPKFSDDPYYDEDAIIVNDEGTILLTGGAPASVYSDYSAYVDDDTTLHFANADNDYQVSTPETDIRNPVFDGQNLKWFDGPANTFYPTWRQFDPTGADSIPDTITDVIAVWMTGQSNSVGFGSPASIITTTAISSGRVMMFNGGTRPMQNDNSINNSGGADTGLRPIQDTQFQSLTDLYEQRGGSLNDKGETHGGGVGYWTAANLSSTTLIVYATFGVGGIPIIQCLPGHYPWNNMLRATDRLKAWCDLKGLNLTVPCLMFDQGEADINSGTSATTYVTNLLSMQASFDTAMNAIVGTQASPRPVIFQQISSAGFYVKTDETIPAAVLDAAIANPTKIIPNMPEYFVTFDDGAHLSDQSRRLAGEYLGRTLVRLLNSQSNKALYATSASNSGLTLTLITNAASTLVKDTSAVSDPGQNGIRLFKTSDDSEITLSSVSVSSPNITATCGSPLTPGQSYYVGIGYRMTVGAGVNAGPTTGHRTNFRDSDAETASTAAGGGSMSNWMLHQKITFTAT
jgi:hypothetical protein